MMLLLVLSVPEHLDLQAHQALLVLPHLVDLEVMNLVGLLVLVVMNLAVLLVLLEMNLVDLLVLLVNHL